MNEPSIAQRIEHRVHDEVHECVRPGCGQRARVAFHVGVPMRLAGRDFMPDEFVDLCPAHDVELRRVASEAVALGFGGPFDRVARLVADEYGEANPLDRLKEWLP